MRTRDDLSASADREDLARQWQRKCYRPIIVWARMQTSYLEI